MLQPIAFVSIKKNKGETEITWSSSSSIALEQAIVVFDDRQEDLFIFNLLRQITKARSTLHIRAKVKNDRATMHSSVTVEILNCLEANFNQIVND